jgi:CheY-like chemotaxis protein
MAAGRILIADDEPILCTTLQKILSDQGYQVSA